MRCLYILITLFLVSISHAQDFKSKISDYLENSAHEFNFEQSDLKSFNITNKSYSKSMDLYNVYTQQNHQGIPILNAIGSFAIKQNRVVSLQHSFISNLDQKVETTSSSLSAGNALSKISEELNINTNFEFLETISHQEYVFQSDVSSEISPVRLVYILTAENKLRLAWDLSILTPEGTHWWSISVDANTGEILRQNDWMLNCNFDYKTQDDSHYHGKSHIQDNIETLSMTTDGSQYRAYPLGVESPNHGNRVLLSQPADPTASPFGWHDTDGIAGAEYSITRGNNVLASEDREGENIPGYSPDGGTHLNFDFPIDENLPAFMNEDAAITNLFVWNNYVHDVWFSKGFDEASGNFQEINYSSEGEEGDFVVADAQDGSGFNNANFGTPPDGINPRMQMFLWSPSELPDDLLTLNTPADIAGEYFGIEAGFGSGLTPTPFSADLVLVEDNNFNPDSTDPHDACDFILNRTALNGKIVVINRGLCLFSEKILAAQGNGAIAVIMINNVPGNPIMMGGDGSNINIPSIMIGLSDGEPIINKLQNGETINATLVNNGPYNIDGNFDNGIIAHEYGHGISNRLTGGSQQANCLFNDEQMGEGWSDWIGLMMTMQASDTDEKPRGYGTFAINQTTTGNGIRPARYSTNMSVNPATYGMTNNENLSIPHGVGYVWASMLWDLTWELIDQYGFDADLINGSGGNNLAMQLVTDGMKLQSCNPGFVDGRDAILQADMLANGGANQCHIWKVFANRGLGYSADQGSESDRFDQVEAFDLPPETILPCEELSIETFGENNFKIYPNPANKVFNIETILGNTGKANLKIFTLNGQELFSKSIEFSQLNQIDISKLSTGIYVLKIENQQIHISKKLIVE